MWPVIGGLVRFLKGPVAMIREEYPKLGSVFTLNLLNKKITFLIGPEVSAHFFNGFESDMSQQEVYRFNVPTFGPGVVCDVDYSVRQEQFRFFSESLRVSKLKSYVDQVLMEAQRDAPHQRHIPPPPHPGPPTPRPGPPGARRNLRENHSRAQAHRQIGERHAAVIHGLENTSSITAAWTGAYLLSNKKCLASVLDEQKNLVKKHGRSVDHDVLSEMEVLYRCIKEALRLHPPLIMLLRTSHSDFTVKTREGKEYDIPKARATSSPRRLLSLIVSLMFTRIRTRSTLTDLLPVERKTSLGKISNSDPKLTGLVSLICDVGSLAHLGWVLFFQAIGYLL
ncbi:hypothetical protein RHMOL_Rhmol12G0019200 [Rhododendron molle]|uniref:Uncharacterized protein n=1 Tax=Rhododendron molle TaxID=49168 RepID=A0ACC0LEH5_RHOML|nr:hypothetical protein RHMOL_Rhmol12G0019200 [Rhododendron molle]